MKNKSLSKLLDKLVIVGILLTILSIFATPFILESYFKSYFQSVDLSIIIKVTSSIYICSLPYLIALFNLKRISALVVRSTPFSYETVKSLNLISICAFSEIFTFLAAIYYLKGYTLFFKSIITSGLSIVVIFICVAVGLLCRVLAQLFEQTIEIKEENDKTI